MIDYYTYIFELNFNIRNKNVIKLQNKIIFLSYCFKIEPDDVFFFVDSSVEKNSNRYNINDEICKQYFRLINVKRPFTKKINLTGTFLHHQILKVSKLINNFEPLPFPSCVIVRQIMATPPMLRQPFSSKLIYSC